MGVVLAYQVRMMMLWPGHWYLLDEKGHKRKTWQMGLGQRGWEERSLWDSRRGRFIRGSLLAAPVRHPEHPEVPLWLVICRSFERSPWYR